MKWLRIALFVGLLLLLVGCGQKDLQEVKVGEVTRSIFYAPLYAAIEEGFLRMKVYRSNYPLYLVEIKR